MHPNQSDDNNKTRKECQTYMLEHLIMTHNEFVALWSKNQNNNKFRGKTKPLKIITSVTILHICHLAGDILTIIISFLHANICDLPSQNQNTSLMQNNCCETITEAFWW